MRRKLGSVCMVLGGLLLAGALGLMLYNRAEARRAEQSVRELLPQLIEEIRVQQTEPAETPENEDFPLFPQLAIPEKALEMSETEIDGHAYIGILSIPKLSLDLPIMADWDYPKLKIAPCRYYGTLRGGDLVLMSHSYSYHFGRLSELSPGDTVIFTDVNGIATEYAVIARDVLDPTAVEEMTAGDFDLTLFTCTYSGNSRMTVYCDRTK